MANLIRYITDVAQAGFGINILDESPPTIVTGVQTNRVGVVADLPWGPYEPQVITSASQLLSLYVPSAFEAQSDYPSLQAFVNKTFGGPLVVKRVKAGSTAGGDPAVAATLTFQDATPVDSVVVTAKYPGVNGNKITVEWIDGTAPASQATAIVRIGDKYKQTYKDVVSGTTVTDPGDAFVTFEAAAGIAERPATAAAASLASGYDGTVEDVDWAGTPGSFEGAYAFTAIDNPVDILFGAEVPTASVAAFNASLVPVATEAVARAVLSTSANVTSATEITAVNASTRSDRTYRVFPKVKTTDALSGNGQEIVVDGNAFMAAALSLVPPEISPAGRIGRAALQQVTGVEYAFTQGEYDALRDAGVVAFFPTTTRGTLFYGGRVTELTLGKREGTRRAMADFILKSLANFNVDYIGEPLDVDIGAKTFGPVTARQVGGMHDFMKTLVDNDRISRYEFNFFAGTAQDIAQGRWIIKLSVKLFNSQQEIILVGNIGPSVQFEVN